MLLKRNLKRLLAEQDITAAQLARKAGIPKTTLSEWLAGGNPRDLNKLKVVAGILGVTIDDLCFNDRSSRANSVEQHLDEINAGIFEVVLRKVKES